MILVVGLKGIDDLTGVGVNEGNILIASISSIRSRIICWKVRHDIRWNNGITFSPVRAETDQYSAFSLSAIFIASDSLNSRAAGEIASAFEPTRKMIGFLVHFNTSLDQLSELSNDLTFVKSNTIKATLDPRK